MKDNIIGTIVFVVIMGMVTGTLLFIWSAWSKPTPVEKTYEEQSRDNA